MELKEEFWEAKAREEENFHLNLYGEVSVFEVNICYLRGFLLVFCLVGKEVIQTKDIELGEKLLPALKTPWNSQ